MSVEYPRARDDLEIRKRASETGDVFVVHDPIANTFAEFDTLQFYILQQLNGQRSIATIVSTVMNAHSAEITPDDLMTFVDGLREAGLIDLSSDESLRGEVGKALAAEVLRQIEIDGVRFRPAGSRPSERTIDAQMIDSAMQALQGGDPRRATIVVRALLARSPTNRRAHYLLHLLLQRRFRKARDEKRSLLFLRFPAFNPERLFARIAAVVGPLLGWRHFPLLWLGLVVSGAAFVWLNVDAAMKAVNANFTLSELTRVHVIISAVLCAQFLTILHEFAHGIVCTAFGGRVREIGLLIAYFAPGAYCDTSSTYLLDSRRQKVLVQAIGPMWDIACVVALACIVVVIPVDTFASSLFLITSAVMAPQILGNLHPFTKNDGYLALTELLNEPSLREDAFALLEISLRRFLLGPSLAVPDDLWVRRRVLLGYALPAFVLTTMLSLLTLSWVAYLAISHLGIVGLCLATALISLTLYSTLRRIARWLSLHGRTLVASTRARVFFLGACAAVVCVLAYPAREVALADVRAIPDEEFVRAPFTGTLQDVTCRDGDAVSDGMTLATCVRPDAAVKRARNTASQAALDAERDAVVHPATAEVIERTRAQIESVSRSIASLSVQMRAAAAAAKRGLADDGRVAALRQQIAHETTRLEQWRGVLATQTRAPDADRLAALDALAATQRLERVQLMEAESAAIIRATATGSVRFLGASRDTLEGAPVRGGDPIFAIRLQKPLRFELRVSEKEDLAGIRPGEAVDFKLFGYPDESFTARVVVVAAEATDAAEDPERNARIASSDGAAVGRVRVVSATIAETRQDIPRGARGVGHIVLGERANALRLVNWLRRSIEPDLLRLLSRAPS